MSQIIPNYRGNAILWGSVIWRYVVGLFDAPLTILALLSVPLSVAGIYAAAAAGMSSGAQIALAAALIFGPFVLMAAYVGVRPLWRPDALMPTFIQGFSHAVLLLLITAVPLAVVRYYSVQLPDMQRLITMHLDASAQHQFFSPSDGPPTHVASGVMGAAGPSSDYLPCFTPTALGTSQFGRGG